jgi:hypothetical protein
METQEDINKGQRNINYELCKVDERLIETLKVIAEFLKKVKELPPLANDLKDFDLSKMDEALAKAQATNKRVADIKPPGCEPPTYPT